MGITKNTRCLLVGVLLFVCAIAAERMHQNRITSDARTRLLTLINDSQLLASSSSEDTTVMLRDHVKRGIGDIELAEASWKHVEFRVSNAAAEELSVAMWKKDGVWKIQTILIND